MIEKLIAKLRSYDHVSESECQALAAAFGTPVICPRGAVVIHARQAPSSSALLLSGFADRVKDLSDGRCQSIEIYVPGDFLNLDSYVSGRSDHDIRCLSACWVTNASHVRLREVTAEFPRLARLLWLNTTFDAALHRERIVSLGARIAIERLAHFVCETALRLKVVELGDEQGFDLPLTQGDLAELMGISLVHTSRTISELRERALADLAHRRVQIIDWVALKKLAEFDGKYLESRETNRIDIRLAPEMNDARTGNERRQHQSRPPGCIPDIAERGIRRRLLD